MSRKQPASPSTRISGMQRRWHYRALENKTNCVLLPIGFVFPFMQALSDRRDLGKDVWRTNKRRRGRPASKGEASRTTQTPVTLTHCSPAPDSSPTRVAHVLHIRSLQSHIPQNPQHPKHLFLSPSLLFSFLSMYTCMYYVCLYVWCSIMYGIYVCVYVCVSMTPSIHVLKYVCYASVFV